jgi:hypothetical protein
MELSKLSPKAIGNGLSPYKVFMSVQ